MSTRVLTAAAYMAIIGGASLNAGCEHLENRSNDIVLNGFSDRNYIKLNRVIGTSVCIRGRISNDMTGVYFALQPIRVQGVIDVGFSRIISGLSIGQARRNNMADGRRYRVCGILRDATPFRHCDYDHCKWYQLENAELR